ncbi:MAG: carbohydrate-binding protein, partial [Bacteroidales bacterium]|nr:carbohydrate-binding protein [Bacteroidales bacterium]
MKEKLLIICKRACMAFLTGIICYTGSSQSVDLWMTSGSGSERLQHSTESFGSGASGSSTISINEGTSYQTIDGLGFMLTEGSAEVMRAMSSSARNTLLNELFSESGLGLSAIRISIGASDLSSSTYTYQDGASFSLAGPDLTYLIPVIKEIHAINPNIKILATPWTAPLWMKTNGSWIGGSLGTDYYDDYAVYFVNYLNAMRNQGIEIWAITPQNEPGNPYNEPSMTMTESEQLNFINNHLGPQIRGAGYSTKIICYDHNCDNTSFPINVANGSSYVDGAGFHLYAGDISALTTVRNATGKNVYFTEQYTDVNGSFSGDLGWHMQNVTLGSVNNWAKTVFEWNLATNTNLGPRTPGGCSVCLGALTISGDSYTRNVSYYIMGQMSKVIRAGAVRIGSSSSNGSLVQSAFRNPDGSIALVVYNNSGSTITFNVSFGGSSFDYSLGGGNVVSFLWSGSGPVTGIPVPGIIEAEDYSTMSGIQTEACSEGGENIGWVDAGDWADYNVDVSSSGTYTVNFRVAADGSDAKSVQLQAGGSIATANFTATGGWQNWTTATSQINLNAGSQIVRLYFPVAGINVNFIEIVQGVTPVLTSILVSPSNVTLEVGQTQQFTATGYDQNGNVMSISPSWSGTNSSGLFTATSAGTFTVTASQGGISGSAAVIVNSADQGVSVPGTIQAEDYTAMSGIQTESTSDAGGGLNVGWIDAGDWMEYLINASSAGTYVITYRIASLNGGGQVTMSRNGTNLATTSIPSTGGWQNWTDVTANVSLVSGTQTIRLTANSGGWNLNYWRVTEGTTTVPVTGVSISPTSMSLTVGGTQQLTA